MDKAHLPQRIFAAGDALTVIAMRRQVLMLSLLLLVAATGVSGKSRAEKLGWKLALQTWTFHKNDLVTTIEKARELGVKYLEVFPGQKIGGQWDTKGFDYNLSASDCKALLKYAASKGVRFVGTGVFVPSKSDEWAKVFAFAKRMRLEYISCEPALDDWDIVESLVRKTGVRVSVHNHPMPSSYWDPAMLLSSISHRSGKIGSCGDVGHWKRCGLNPVECMKMLKGRLVSFHFKDIVDGPDPESAHDTIWGEGILNVKAMLQEMKRQRFKGYLSIEYEYNWDNSMPEIKRSIANFNRMAEDL